MTREETWERLVAKNPQWRNDDNIVLSKRTLRRLFDLVWDKAEEELRATQVPDLFNALFGTRRPL